MEENSTATVTGESRPVVQPQPLSMHHVANVTPEPDLPTTPSSPVSNVLNLDSPSRSRRDSIATRHLSRILTLPSSLFTAASSPASLLGVSVTSADNSTWVITVNRLGRWVLGSHLLLLSIAAFGFATDVLSWYSNQDDNRIHDSMMSSIGAIAKSHSEISESLSKWMSEEQSSRSEESKAEQQRWNAFLRWFEQCGSPAAKRNNTLVCDVHQYFEETRLPRPDTSPLAKRNLAKLDTIIREIHLDINPGVKWAPMLHEVLMYALAAFLLCYLSFAIMTRLTDRLSWRLSHSVRKIRSRRSEKAHFTNATDADGVAVTNSYRADNDMSRTLVSRRGPVLPDAFTLAARGDLDRLRPLFEGKTSVHVDQTDKDNEYGSLFAAACRSGNEATVDFLLSKAPNLQYEGGRYHSVLQSAAHSGNELIVRRLIKMGAKEARSGGFYGSAITAAAERGSLPMLEALLEVVPESSVETFGGTHGFALIAAAARGESQMIEILQKAGADVNAADNAGTTALHTACLNNHLDTVKSLINRGSELNVLSSKYGTALQIACRAGYREVVQTLLDHQADLSIKHPGSLRTMMHEVASTQGNDLLQAFEGVLKSRPDLMDEVDVDGNTALHIASISGNTSIARALIVAGANCGIGDKFEAQPLFRATGCYHTEIVWSLLYEGNADPNATDSFGRTALHGPSQTENVKAHKYLLERGANVNAVGNDKKTALHEACNMGRKANVELLLEQPGVRVNEIDNDGFTPLYKALCSSDGNPEYFGKCVNADIPLLLLSHPKIDVNASDGIAIQEAARKGMYNVVEEMIERHSADVQSAGGKYGSVLQAAAISGNVDIISLLLRPQHRVDVNQKGGEYGSALAAAAAFGHVDVVQKLLTTGADPCLKGGRYGSPWQSICRGLDRPVKVNERYRLSMPIERLLMDFSGDKANEKAVEEYADWRWLLRTNGWGWLPPGDM